MPMIDLDTAKLHLRIDGGAEDALLPLYIRAAEQAAVEYVNRNLYADQAELSAAVLAGTAGASPLVVNDLMRAAMLLTLGDLHSYREDTQARAVTALPTGARALLQPYRIYAGI